MATIYSQFNGKFVTFEIDTETRRLARQLHTKAINKRLRPGESLDVSLSDMVGLRTINYPADDVADGEEIRPGDLIVTEIAAKDGDIWRSITNGKDVRSIHIAHFDTYLLENMVYNPNLEKHAEIWETLKRKGHDHQQAFVEAITTFCGKEFLYRYLNDLRTFEGGLGKKPTKKRDEVNRVLSIEFAGSGIKLHNYRDHEQLQQIIDHGLILYKELSQLEDEFYIVESIKTQQ